MVLMFQIVSMCFFIIVALIIMVKRKFEEGEVCPKNSMEMTERKRKTDKRKRAMFFSNVCTLS